MAKNLPKRQGEVVDLICKEAGIEDRQVRGSPVLNKREAIAVCELIRTLKKMEETRERS